MVIFPILYRVVRNAAFWVRLWWGKQNHQGFYAKNPQKSPNFARPMQKCPLFHLFADLLIRL